MTWKEKTMFFPLRHLPNTLIKYKKPIIMRLLITLLFSFLAIGSWSQTINFTGVLEGSQEVPPVSTTGTGTMGASYDMATNTLMVHANFADLTTVPNNAHIHAAPAGASGGVIFGLMYCGTATEGAISGTGTLTAAQEIQLLNNEFYLNLHTTMHGSGELRAQLIQLIDVENNTFAGVLEGAQENPPVTTSATGVATAIYNADTGELTVGATYSDLSAPPSAAHVHNAPIGTNGGVLFGLTVCGTAASGRAAGQAILSSSEATALLNGDLYVNIHNSNNTGGEVRAQLLLQQTQLVGKLEGSQEVPPVTTTGSGKVAAYYNHNNMGVTVRGTFENLMSNPNNAHIHTAPTGTSGGVVVGLTFTGNASSGTIGGGGTFTGPQATSFLNGDTYVNLHTVNNGSGELRAQLGTSTNALPLELLNFKVEKTKTANRLVWETNMEREIESFEIEHQNKQESFKKMHVIAAKGANRTWTRYEYQLPILTKGTHFFRLKIKETDGKIYYSDMVSLVINTLPNPVEIAIHPNPFQQEMNIDFNLNQAQVVEVLIYNYAGVLVAKPYHEYTETAQTTKISFDSKNLPAGLYYIDVKGSHFTSTQKVLKN